MLGWLRYAVLAFFFVGHCLAFAQTIGPVTVAPGGVAAGVAASVTVTAVATSPDIIPASINLQRVDPQGRATVVGSLRDDGLNGDAVANDKVYSIRFTVYEQNPGSLTYRVSAGVLGKLTRIFSSPIVFAVTGTAGTGVSISQPANLLFVNNSPIIVAGATGDPAAQVTVNGIQASKSGSAFQTTVPLQEGSNILTAVATNPNGATSTASVEVTLDTTPPRVSIESPAHGSVTTESSVTVRGIVNDIVLGTVNSQQAQVTVNGVTAQVANRTFTAADIPLQMGLNTIQVVGRDQVGNSATVTTLVTREVATRPFVKLVSGNNQAGPIATALAAPLVVQLLNGATPVANTPVIFRIRENDGFLQPGAGKPQMIIVNSDAQGRAQAVLTLGNRAGAGNNVVEAYAVGFQGTAVFAASGVPKQAAKINVDTGTNQFAAVGQSLPLPFVAVVTDEGHNRLKGVPVTFAVKQGGGKINDASFLQTVTDSDGRALAVLTLGSQPGQDNNVVEATFPGNPGFPAAFAASAKVPGDPAHTSISGVVLDNSNDPLPNVTMRVFRAHLGSRNNTLVEVAQPVPTDDKGAFRIAPAPVGFFKLMADGTTSTQAGKTYPTLEYDIVTVAGQDNTVGSPIYLPALDPGARVCVNETTGGVLRVASSPGFSLTILPGAATFPGGSKSGCVSVTPVNPDKVPMVPGFGQQPRYVVTIQPVGTTFNPPAAMTIPNVDGLAPNAKTEMYSYDHDLAAFVAIGSARVSADGAIIASDPGVGVIKAGWHCGGNPNTTGSAGHCGDCKKCDSSSCIPDLAQNDQICQPSTGTTGVCRAGSCSPISVQKIQYQVGANTGAYKDFSGVLRTLFGKNVFFKAIPSAPITSFPSGKPVWQGSFGVSGAGAETAHTYSGPASISDSDTKTVTTDLGPSSPQQILVCSNVLGIHSNVEPTAGLTDGHAWISVKTVASASSTTVTYGLWPDDHPSVIAAGLNGPGSDVRVGFEPSSGRYNRYYLVCPAQLTNINAFIASNSEWGYLHTCANWAEEAIRASVGETVSSSDFGIFGTPRAISGSIKTLELSAPTTPAIPLNGGEQASSSVPGNSSFGGSSFPSSFGP